MIRMRGGLRADPSGYDRIVFYPPNKVLWEDDNGNVRGIYSGLSGSRRLRPLPPGYYIGSNYRRRTRKGMVCGRNGPDQVGFSIDLDPQFSTDRTLLRIHPDEPPPGTEGCIGIACADARDFQRALDDYFKTRHNSTIQVWVTQ